MVQTDYIAYGQVVAAAINGKSVQQIDFGHAGPFRDKHIGFTRELSGHDGGYIRTFDLKKGKEVFNWRSFTALSAEDVGEMERRLGYEIPVGCLLENLRISGGILFPKLKTGSLLAFPERSSGRAILALWEQNSPCRTVGERLAEHHNNPALIREFIREAKGKRGIMGFVISPGTVQVGDDVYIYPPVSP